MTDSTVSGVYEASICPPKLHVYTVKLGYISLTTNHCKSIQGFFPLIFIRQVCLSSALLRNCSYISNLKVDLYELYDLICDKGGVESW